jgi:tetratricopeptide (TPR) repeat protein
MKFLRALVLPAALAAFLPAALPAESVADQAADAIKQGEFARAGDLLEPLVASGHADASSLFNMSLVRLAQRQTEEAVKYAERATKADPTKLEYFFQLGTACDARIREVGPMDANALAAKMRKAYEKVLSIDPKFVPALIGMVHFFEHAPEIAGGSLKKAQEFAERLREVDAYQGELELGRLASGLKDYESAVTHYDAAVKVKPDDVSTATASGWSLYKLGRKEEARARFEAVLKLQPDFEPAKMGLTETATPAH